ncbi:MAG: helix-turn-helix domain-containing protein, partial [Pseudorhodobacter sp.]
MNLPARPMPRPTAQVQPYVDAMGPELAMKFILHFGGAELWIPKNLKGDTEFEAMIGPSAAQALVERAGRLQKRVPLAKAWLTAMLDWQGLPASEIARRLRVS